jgi:hypothetical protein
VRVRVRVRVCVCVCMFEDVLMCAQVSGGAPVLVHIHQDIRICCMPGYMIAASWHLYRMRYAIFAHLFTHLCHHMLYL